MSSDTLLHDLYTLFFSYTQSSLYRSALASLTTNIRSLLPASQRSTGKQQPSSTLFVESRLQREFGFYSLSSSLHANGLSQAALVQLSFVLFAVFLLAIPALTLLCLSLSLHHPLLLCLCALSTAYVTISTVVYSLVLLQSLSAPSGGAQFPLALSSLVYLYFLNVLSFALVYLAAVQTYDGDKGGGGAVLNGVIGADGLVNVVHVLYFSISTFTTVGFGDIHAVWWVARLFVSLELCLSSLLHILVFSQGLSIIVSRRTAAAPTSQSDAAAYGVGGKRE